MCKVTEEARPTITQRGYFYCPNVSRETVGIEREIKEIDLETLRTVLQLSLDVYLS